MPTIDSPLRYPGGKTQLSPLVIDLLRKNDLFYGAYIEPCAGGAGIAWKLLLNSYVSQVYINDIDPAIYAFWHCVLNKTDDLCEKIETTKISVWQWRRQRAILNAARPKVLDLAFATFFLNRTNRSGIIRGGIIGGLKQDGDYSIDCRFNKSDLIRKIRRIGARRDQISLYRLDAAHFLRTILPRAPRKALVNLDPPYFVNGPMLYKNHYTPRDHALLASEVGRIRQNWMVTYDDTPETRRLYAQYPSFRNELNYSAQVKRAGIELLVLDPRMDVPDALGNLYNARSDPA